STAAPLQTSTSSSTSEIASTVASTSPLTATATLASAWKSDAPVKAVTATFWVSVPTAKMIAHGAGSPKTYPCPATDSLPDNVYKCAKNRQLCLNAKSVLDGIEDCPDGEDEGKELKSIFIIQNDIFFRCKSSRRMRIEHSNVPQWHVLRE